MEVEEMGYVWGCGSGGDEGVVLYGGKGGWCNYV